MGVFTSKTLLIQKREMWNIFALQYIIKMIKRRLYGNNGNGNSDYPSKSKWVPQINNYFVTPNS